MRRSIALLIVLVLTISSIGSVLPVKAEAAVDTKKALVFLKDVVGIDVEKYEVTLISSTVQDYTSKDNPIGDLGYIQTSGVYQLTYWDIATESYSGLDVTFSFANSTLRLCTLEVFSGEPYYSKALSSNMREAAAVLLERYEALSSDLKLTAMRNMLTTVDVTKDSTKIEGNLKLEVSATSDHTSLAWIQSQNGVDYNSLTLEFKHGAFRTFFDSRSYRKVGSAEINISQEQAIAMALKEADGFSYTYNDKLVDNLTIVESQIRAELKANVRDTPTLFYPRWTVALPLDKVYPGSVYYIEVMIWADTGQVISCKTMGYGGPYPDDSSSDSASSEPLPTATPTAENTNTTQAENNSPTPSAVIIAIIIAAIFSSTFTAALIVKKRKRKAALA
jgi:hypothetical protein